MGTFWPRKIQPTLETFHECEEDWGVKVSGRYMEINEMLC
jgi:hypothetical protein